MESLIEIISEEEFLPLIQHASEDLLIFCNYINTHSEFSKKLYVNIIKESTELEDFLDEYGAINNKSWIYFRELVACIRNFSSVAYMLSHLLRRFKLYRLTKSDYTNFLKDAQKALAFFNQSLKDLFQHLQKEAIKRSLKLPPNKPREEAFEDVHPTRLLPHNVDEEGEQDVERNIAKVVTKYLNTVTQFFEIDAFEKISFDKLVSYIPEKINEEILRRLESAIHNTQSMYDTYIHKTQTETRDERLPTFRGYISVSLHLLEIGRTLSHFYERHQMELRHEKTRRKLEKIVSKEDVLKYLFNFSLFYCAQFMREGKQLAEVIIKEYTEIDTIELNVPEGLGFHLRPSTLIAKIVSHYGTEVKMIVNGREFDASSPLDLMWAGGMIKREGIKKIIFKGDKRVLQDLKLLASVNYGEDIMGRSIPLPKELSYLK